MLRPLGARVAIKVLEPEEVTKGGIILAETAKQPSETGVVVSIGNDVKEVEVGDSVLFPLHSGIKTRTESGEELLIMKEEDLFAVLEEKYVKDIDI